MVRNKKINRIIQFKNNKIIINPDLINLFNYSLNNKITPNRVKSIILDQSHEKFEDLGGWNALGTIETSDGRFIRPLNSNSKIFPLINEIVYIVEGLNISGENPQFTIPSSYYITNVGIWNHPHHNAYPNEDISQNKEEKVTHKKDPEIKDTSHISQDAKREEKGGSID